MRTNEQQQVIDYIASMSGNSITVAKPGAGKSTTLAGAASALPIRKDEILCVVLMKKTAEDTKRRMPLGVEVINANKLGYDILREHFGRVNRRTGKSSLYPTNENKYRLLAFDLFKERYPELVALAEMAHKERKKLYNWTNSLQKAASIIRMNMIDPSDEAAVAEKCKLYGIRIHEYMHELLPLLIERGMQRLQETGFHDFEDQIYAPVALNLEPTRKYQIVMLDEVQDMAPAAIHFGKMLSSQLTHACGDPRQTIMGFSGVPIDSFYQAKDILNAREFELSRTFRFGKNIAAQVADITPIDTTDNGRPDGAVYTILSERLLEMIQPEDAVIARFNKHLLSFACRCIANGVPVRLMGDEDVANKILDTLKEFEKSGFYAGYGTATTMLELWKKENMRKMDEEDVDYFMIQNFERSVDNLYAVLAECQNLNSLDELRQRITQVLESKEGTVLLSCHKAKGGEWKRVFLLNCYDFHPDAEKDKGKPQELLLEDQYVRFVAYTRASEVIYEVPDWESQREEIKKRQRSEVNLKDRDFFDYDDMMGDLDDIAYKHHSQGQPQHDIPPMKPTLLRNLMDTDLELDDLPAPAATKPQPKKKKLSAKAPKMAQGLIKLIEDMLEGDDQ